MLINLMHLFCVDIICIPGQCSVHFVIICKFRFSHNCVTDLCIWEKKQKKKQFPDTFKDFSQRRKPYLI